MLIPCATHILTLYHIFLLSFQIICTDSVSPNLVDHINSVQNSWIAGHYGAHQETFRKRVMNLKFIDDFPNLSGGDITWPQIENLTIPDHFDAREQWPQCISIGNIRDQAMCSACWAFAAAEAISDRTCIHSNATVNVILSAEDMLSCCRGADQCGWGCDGGYHMRAWNWWVQNGLVTGGSYESQSGCKPLSISPCGITVNNVTWPSCPYNSYETPSCELKCTSKNGYDKSYEEDKHFGATSYHIPQDPQSIQLEVLKNGPVEVMFRVYEDFYQYKSGIYKHTAGAQNGAHSVRLIGWGSENGVDFWLIANSWNVIWGEQGYFRILRGVNECEIEERAMGGIPKN